MHWVFVQRRCQSPEIAYEKKSPASPPKEFEKQRVAEHEENTWKYISARNWCLLNSEAKTLLKESREMKWAPNMCTRRSWVANMIEYDRIIQLSLAQWLSRRVEAISVPNTTTCMEILCTSTKCVAAWIFLNMMQRAEDYKREIRRAFVRRNSP